MTGNKDVYIVLTGTGSLLSQTIKLFTRAPLNHASIAFDSRLDEVYSFGRKNVSNPFIGGFVKENYADPFFHRADCAIYRYQVERQQYEAMYGYVNKMMANRERYKYHLLGLVGVLLNKNFARPDAFFCSQFVACVLEKTGLRPLKKPSYLVTPGDLEQSFSNDEIFRGKLSEYLFGSGQTRTA